MFFLENKIHYRLASLLGISAFAYPEQAPWSLLATLLVAATTVCSTSGRGRTITLLLSASLFVGVAGGLLSAAFVTAVLAAATIAAHNRLLALAILALQTSYAASLEAITANYLFAWHLEASAPALLSGALLLAVQTERTWWRVVLALLPLPLVWGAQKLGAVTYGLLAIAALPAMVLAALTPGDERPILKGARRWIVAGVVVLAAIGWALTPPKTPEAGYVLLLGETNSPDARFYRNYQEVLQFAGISAKVVEAIEDIPPNSLVLLPWLTSSAVPDSAPSFDRLRELAKERRWLVVMVGEHTDMGSVATRVQALVGRPFLRDDLSVPQGNTDDSGHMRSADIRAWHPDAMLNRGGSVDVRSPLTRVLLSGDGWWAEPDIGEWLWVGDYMWQPSDRHGRLVMAAAADEGPARWVVIGDTGPFINQQLVSDPRPAARILELSTLWPLFLRDVGLVIIAAGIVFGLPTAILIGMAGLIVMCSLLLGPSNNGPWRSLWRQESGFDERNFNQALLESPQLLTTDWSLVRPKGPLGDQLPTPEKRTVIFGLIDEELIVGRTKLSNCRRLGSLSTDGILLMDAQACKVDGNAEVLVGDKDEAAIVQIGSLLLVLDQNFLGQKAPPSNRTWLEGQLNKNLPRQKELDRN